jgi:serine/threonine protein phosphatase PrpC
MAQLNTIYRAHANKRELDYDAALYNPSPEIVSKNREIIHFEGATKQTAGQDVVLTKRFNDSDMLIGCFDGHGDKGHYHSYIVSGLLSKVLYKSIPILKRHLEREGNIDKLKEFLTFCYVQTQQQLYNGSFSNIDEYSGTTAAVAIVLMVTINGVPTRKLISTNVGDSCILWKGLADDKSVECSLEHNCDCMKAVEAYLKRLSAKRTSIRQHLETEVTTERRFTLEKELNDYQPRQIYYFRTDSPVSTWLYSQGYTAPLSLFNYTDDDTPELNQVDYEIISAYYPHGQQSIRVPKTYVREDGRTVVVSGLEHENWGATLAGCTQTLNGFGDRGYHPHISAVPHISVHDITQSGKLLVASDGLLDLFHFDDLMMFIQNHNDNFEALLYTHIFETASNHVQYTTVTDTSTDVLYPTWDDVSAVVVSFV